MADIDILEVLKKVQGDREAKRVFFAMPGEEQLMSIMGIQAYIANELANVQKMVNDLSEDVAKDRRSNLAYRRRREEREGNGHDEVEDMTITQKIIGAAKRRFDQIVIIAGIIYLIWEKKP